MRGLFEGCARADATHAGHRRAIPGERRVRPEAKRQRRAKYLKQLLDKGDVALALAAYHAELTTADATGKVPDIKDRDYADAILKRVR